MLRTQTQGATVARGGVHDKEMQGNVRRCLRAKKPKAQSWEAKTRSFLESKTLHCANNAKSSKQQWLKMSVDYCSKNVWNDMKVIIII